MQAELLICVTGKSRVRGHFWGSGLPMLSGICMVMALASAFCTRPPTHRNQCQARLGSVADPVCLCVARTRSSALLLL